MEIKKTPNRSKKTMQAKSVLYAAVGAPVVAARKVGDQVSTLRGKVSKETANYSEVATRAIDGWAAEGEKVVNQITEGKVVEEISSKVDLDQAKEQVSKLRDQLEDMLATWRTSFRPEKSDSAAKDEDTKAPAKVPAKKPAAKPATKPAASETTTKAKATGATKPAAKSSAAKTTKSSSATKKSSAKTPAAKAKTS
jgi:hypothetical protein